MKKRSRSNPRSASATMAGADKHAARELMLYLENDRQMNAWKEPYIKNIAKKIKKGTYDSRAAVKLWSYWVESGAKRYAAEYGDASAWMSTFTPATRRLVSQVVSRTEANLVRNGEYNYWLKRK